jgi:hypothetical protein
LPSAFSERTKDTLNDKLRSGMEGHTMPRAKQASKRKPAKKAVPVLGVAGLSLLAGGASATTVGPAQTASTTPGISPNQAVIFGEEEISDVNLATFYVFDKEGAGVPEGSVQLARGGCGGCRGCGGGCRGCGGRGCRGCGFGGCGWGCGGCGCTCCLSWGACRWC